MARIGSCAFCDGTGKFKYGAKTKSDTCHICDGTGVISDNSAKVPTPKLWPDPPSEHAPTKDLTDEIRKKFWCDVYVTRIQAGVINPTLGADAALDAFDEKFDKE